MTHVKGQMTDTLIQNFFIYYLSSLIFQLPFAISHRPSPDLLSSIAVAAEDLASADGAEGAPGVAVDGALDELHAAVCKQGVDPAGVVAA
jgi:hypothetical protein